MVASEKIQRPETDQDLAHLAIPPIMRCDARASDRSAHRAPATILSCGCARAARDDGAGGNGMASPRRAHCTGARRRSLCERATATRPCNGCTTCSEFSFSLVKLAPGITATVTVHGRRIVGERSLCRRLRMVLDSLQDCPWKACMSSDHTLQPVSPTRDVRENTKR